MSAVCFSCLFRIGLIDFLVSSCFFSCIFLLSAGKKSSVVLSSGSSVFEIFSLHRDIFLSSAEKFFHPIPVFSVLFLNSFRRKSLFFRLPLPVSGHFFLTFRIIFKLFSYSVGNFSLRIHNFSTFLRTFRKENSHFSEWIFRPAAFFGGEFFNNSGIWGLPECLFSAGFVQAPAVFFLRHPDFSSGIFCILRMPPAMFFPAIPALFPFFCLSRLWKISCFPASVWIFRTNQTRAHSHARNKIWSSLRTFLFLLPQDMP